MNLKPCPGCGVKESVAFSKDKPSQAYCINCGVAGPTADTPEEAELFWNLMPRRDDSPNQYVMRIRVKIYDLPGLEEHGYGWLIAIDNAPVVIRDNGQIEMISFKNIEVDNGTEQEKI